MKKSRYIYIIILFIFSLLDSTLWSQEKYNNCNQALQLCPYTSVSVNNIGANKTLCIDCEDDFSSKLCFSSNNSIWLRFISNEIGGDVQISLNNIVYKLKTNQSTNLQASILQAQVPCDASTYKAIGNCELNGATNFILNASGLEAQTTYYVVISGALTAGNTLSAEATFDVLVEGTAIDRKTPSIAIAAAKTAICSGEVLKLESTLTNCKDSSTYRWYRNDTLFAVSDTSSIETASIKNNDIIKVENDCYSTCSIKVSQETDPISVSTFIVDAGKDTTIFENSPIQLKGNTDGDTYYWIPSNHFKNNTLLQPTVAPNKTITYTFFSKKGECTLTDDVTITVRTKNLVPPNTFSPNGDNINDTWEIPFLENFPDCEVKIYTRWGQPVFETIGYSYKKAWDGKYNGTMLDEGVYFFVINLRDDYVTEPIKGSLTLIR